MKISEFFESKYLKTGDLGGKPVIYTINRIEKVKIKEQDGTEKIKPAVYFDEQEKALVLNLTNGNSITEICGEEIEEWIGQKIELYPTLADFKGKRVAAIRVCAPTARSQRQPPPPPQTRLPQQQQQARPTNSQAAPAQRRPMAVQEEPPWNDSVDDIGDTF